jgi:hypothetical protein
MVDEIVRCEKALGLQQLQLPPGRELVRFLPCNRSGSGGKTPAQCVSRIAGCAVQCAQACPGVLPHFLCFERGDNLGVYSLPPQTGFLIPSDHHSQRIVSPESLAGQCGEDFKYPTCNRLTSDHA